MSDFKKALEALRKDLPAGTPPKPQQPKGPARAVVRMERKGRGGKEVTVVEQLEHVDLDKLLKELKNALGCGGAVENGTLVLQGDQRKRLPAILEAKGVRKVIVG
ncbi:MAG: translation initiation factor [Myxococcales bacterium]|nr:translation initiation factor [Myxococcales bacterium]